MLKLVHIDSVFLCNLQQLIGQFSSVVEKGALFLQKCTKCNRRFGWSKIFKSYKWTYGPLECDNCGTIHKITIFGRCTIVFLTMLPFLIVQFFLIPTEHIFLTLGGAVLMSAVGFLLSPYVVRYKRNCEETYQQ